MDLINTPTESTPLLSDSDVRSLTEESQTVSQEIPPRSSNPSPGGQLANVLLANTCNAIAQLSILPFISELVGGLEIIEGDQRKVGFYVGLIESSFQASCAISALHWNQLSDRIGRKPVLLVSTVAAVLSMIWFGLARTFWGLVASRCFFGLIDGFGAINSVIGEVTNSTNRASAFAWNLVSWSFGGTVGSFIGGSLANPHRRFPTLFGSDFWKQYPYFLPCFAVAMMCLLSFLSLLLFFEETVVKSPPLVSNADDITAPSSKSDKMYTVRQLLDHPPVLISISNFVSLDFLFTAEGTLVPVFYAMPPEIGGVGFDPVHIGYILGCYRAFMACFMVTVCPRIIHRYGERFAFFLATLSCMSVWIVLPIINLSARRFGISTPVWVGVVFLTLPLAIMEMGTACNFIYVTASAPSRRSLGAVNGIVRTASAITRATAPVVATSLFSLSVKHNLLGGYAVYAIFFVLSYLAVFLALKLPDRARTMWEGEDERVD